MIGKKGKTKVLTAGSCSLHNTKSRKKGVLEDPKTTKIRQKKWEKPLRGNPTLGKLHAEGGGGCKKQGESKPVAGNAAEKDKKV